MKQGFAGALGAPMQAAQGNQQQNVNPQQVQQAAMVSLQRMLVLQKAFAGVHNEATFKAVMQKFQQASGGQGGGAEDHYNKAEVDKLKQNLVKGIQHLKMGLQHLQGAGQQQPQGMQPQPAAPQQSAAPAPQEG